jgi:hypothetical protein
MNNVPANPTLLGRWVPANPFANPPPDCTKKGADCVAVPNTLDGVNPNQKNKAITGEFNFDQASASVKLGANTNAAGDPNNKKAPIAGTTQRADSLNLPWNAKGHVDFVPTKIKGQKVNALTFGSGLYYQRASWVGPNLFNNEQTQYSIPSKLSFLNCFWTLDDGSTTACPNAPLTLAMGQDDFLDRNGNLLARLAYSYTNDGSDDVDLSNLYFGTSGTQLAVEDLGMAGTPLFNPQVTLNGNPVSLRSDYDVAADYTNQFLFPDTTDHNYIMEGDVSIDGAPQLEFAYEDQVGPAPVPEPGSLVLLGTVAAVMMWIAACRWTRLRHAAGLLLLVLLVRPASGQFAGQSIGWDINAFLPRSVLNNPQIVLFYWSPTWNTVSTYSESSINQAVLLMVTGDGVTPSYFQKLTRYTDTAGDRILPVLVPAFSDTSQLNVITDCGLSDPGRV